MGGVYMVGLVGESHYQAAVASCREGEPVQLFREIGNPFDPTAIVAVNARGDALGYVPRDSFLQRLIHDEERGVSARIAEVIGGTPGKPSRGIVLEVELDGPDVPSRAYVPAPARQPTRPADDDDPHLWWKVALGGAAIIFILELIF